MATKTLFVIEVNHRMYRHKNPRTPFFATSCAVTVIAALAGCGGGGSLSSGAPNSGGPAASRFEPNYADETDPQTNQPNRLLHWAGFPLKVHFAANANLTSERQALAVSGFRWWESSLGGALQIEIVDDASAANISVQFEPKGATSYAGTTQYSYTGDSRLVSAAITLNVSYLNNPAHIPATAAHEFGHALGIGGHSAERSDLMATAPNVVSLFSPTLRDSNTMKTAYVDVLDGLGRSTSDTVVYSNSVSCGAAR